MRIQPTFYYSCVAAAGVKRTLRLYHPVGQTHSEMHQFGNPPRFPALPSQYVSFFYSEFTDCWLEYSRMVRKCLMRTQNVAKPPWCRNAVCKLHGADPYSALT